MSNLKNNFQNNVFKNEFLRETKNTLKPDQRHFQKEPKNIQEGVRKDKKIKMSHKTFN